MIYVIIYLVGYVLSYWIGWKSFKKMKYKYIQWDEEHIVVGLILSFASWITIIATLIVYYDQWFKGKSYEDYR